MIFVPKIYNLNVIMEKYQTARMKDILLNNWPVVIKSVNVMKAKKTSRHCLRLKKIKETWSLNKVLHETLAKTHTLGQLVKLVCGLNGSNIFILSSSY